MQHAEPLPEHLWLQKLVGNWTYESEALMGPDKPPVKGSGKETTRSLGGLWVVGEANGSMPGGGTADMLITIGYNPETKRFVGTWIGSMMALLWVYDGFVEGNTLHLDAEGPSMSGDGKMAKYRDSIEIVNDDHRVLRSQLLGDDGQWNVFMTAHYRRVK
jgi:hypothetical protein